jgi:hypothetical protein
MSFSMASESQDAMRSALWGSAVNTRFACPHIALDVSDPDVYLRTVGRLVVFGAVNEIHVDARLLAGLEEGVRDREDPTSEHLAQVTHVQVVSHVRSGHKHGRRTARR